MTPEMLNVLLSNYATDNQNTVAAVLGSQPKVLDAYERLALEELLKADARQKIADEIKFS